MRAGILDDNATADAIPARSILVVDDDALVRMGVVDMLEDLGHRVVEAGSGAQALDILATGDPIDLLITDHSMPGMTGMQLARAVSEKWPDMPILLATGYIDLPEEDVLKLPRLSKPYDQDQLSGKIATLVRG